MLALTSPMDEARRTVFRQELRAFRPTKAQGPIWEAFLHDPRNIAVRSCNGAGKTALAANMALHWLRSYSPSKVVTTAPTWRQVTDQLWAEIRRWGAPMAPKDWEMLPTTPRIRTRDPDTFALGFSTDKPGRFEGFHSPNLLLIVDEVKGMPDRIFEAFDALQPRKRVYISVPGAPQGPFYEAFDDPEHWVTFHLDAEILIQDPREIVKQAWVDYMRSQWGADSPVYQRRVRGNFSMMSESPYFHEEAVRAAFTRSMSATGLHWLAVDWGKQSDYSALVEGQGRQITRVETMRRVSYMVVVGRIFEMHRAHAFETIIADEGEGVGQIDYMKAKGLPVQGRRWTHQLKLSDCGKLKLAFEEGTIGIIEHEGAREQLLRFERVPMGADDVRLGAPEGMHDDIVTALAMCWSAVEDEGGEWRFTSVKRRR